MNFSVTDSLIVILYMALSVGLGVWIGRGQKTIQDYFLGGRSLPWYAVTFSIVATETSVLTFISIPAVAYQGNLTFIQIVFGYIVGRTLVALLLIPAYFKGKLTTAYHLIGNHFGDGLRRTASVTFMVTRLLADGVRLFATAIPLAIIIRTSEFASGLSDTTLYLISIYVIGVVTIIYTFAGGIRAVVWMDFIQMSVYWSGALLAVYLIWTNMPAGNFSLVTEAGKLKWFDSGLNLSFDEFIKQPYTFFTALIGGAFFSLASHGTDQLTVQRVLTCKDTRSGQIAMFASGLMVFLQFAMFLFLGVLLFAFYGGASFQELGVNRADEIFPKFIIEQMPFGFKGILVASLFAAAMSTLSSSLSSLSSASFLDIYQQLFGKSKSEAELLKVSRFMTVVWGVVLMAVASVFLNLQGTVVEFALGVASYTYGGLLGLFFLCLIPYSFSTRNIAIACCLTLVAMTAIISAASLAWPLYTMIGSIMMVVLAFCFRFNSRKNKSNFFTVR